jgi:hypothetical protein
MEKRIREACEYIENFPDAKIVTAARDFEVPRSALRDRLNGCHYKKGRPGINTKLTKEEEIAICRYIDRLDKINLAVRPEFIADAARSIILARSSTKQQSVEPRIGKFWVIRFLKRHGYSKYRQKTINADHQTAEELGVVQKYLEFTAPKQQGHKRLLIVDGHGSQHMLEFIEFCDSHDIIPVGMPPYLTHLFQPLDVAVFQPLKHYQAKALDTIIPDGCAHITKLEFLAYIQQIRTQAFKESTVKSAFKKTGIHPFNPQVVLQEIADCMPQHTPSPPPHQPSSSVFSTPVTLRHAEKQLYRRVSSEAAKKARKWRIDKILLPEEVYETGRNCRLLRRF